MATPDYPNKLKRQLELLWKACREFDDGDPDKAIEIAVRLRVILHSTNSSTSALKHLNAESINLISTIKREDSALPRPALFEGGLTIFRGKGWVAALDDVSKRRLVPFHDWWESEIVAIYPGNYEYTRRRIVTDTTNKDDGAHIVEKIPGRLMTLIEGPWKSLDRASDGTTIVRSHTNQHFQYLRQIAYEVLHSEELLDLIAVGFRLQTDAQYRKQKTEEAARRLKRLGNLYETARQLISNGSRKEARAILETLEEEIENHIDKNSARNFCIILWAKASTFGTDELVEKLHVFEKLCDIIENRVGKIISPDNYLEIYVKAKFQIGLIYADINEREKSEKSWRTVKDISKANIKYEEINYFRSCNEPLKYYLLSSNNIVTHAMNHGEYDNVITELDQTFEFLGKVCPPFLNEWSESQIEDSCGPDSGNAIAEGVCKGLRNRCIAEFETGNHDVAVEQFKRLKARFSESRNLEIIRLLNEADDVLRTNRNSEQ